MRYISELIDKNRKTKLSESSVMFPDKKRIKKDSKVNLLALGDVGGTVLMGLKLLGGSTISQIGIYDLDEKMARRYEMEINQISFPDGRKLPL